VTFDLTRYLFATQTNNFAFGRDLVAELIQRGIKITNNLFITFKDYLSNFFLYFKFVLFWHKKMPRKSAICRWVDRSCQFQKHCSNLLSAQKVQNKIVVKGDFQTTFLFEKAPHKMLVILAIGRSHFLQPWISYRNGCQYLSGISASDNWSQIPSYMTTANWNILKTLFTNVRDIDLVSA
jgi:hypothetical protein